MDQNQIRLDLIKYVGSELLHNQDAGLDEDTRLFELGMIDSLALVLLLNFMKTQFRVEVPPDRISVQAFKSIRTMTDLVAKLIAEE